VSDFLPLSQIWEKKSQLVSNLGFFPKKWGKMGKSGKVWERVENEAEAKTKTER
jgi:hypothetical protein